MKMKHLAEEEMEIVAKAYKRKKMFLHKSQLDNMKSLFLEQGNFIIAMLRDGENLYIGVAKRNPKDKDNVKIGCTVALFRAASNLAFATLKE